MLGSDIAVLLDHLYWMRDRILVAAEDPSVPFTSHEHPTVRDLRATLVHELGRRRGRFGLATMCIGVGQGIALVVERL